MSVFGFWVRLINITDINRQISELTDRSILLIDTCRAYKDQAKELIEAWKKTVKQGSDVGGILNAIQFASGIYGPTPIIFASDDGMAADTVKYPVGGLSSGTGPLALKLRSVLNDVDASSKGLSLQEFLLAFQSPTVSLPNLDAQEAAKVRGFSFLRADFVAAFGTFLIVSGDPVDVLPRKQAFANPYGGFYSHAGGTEPPVLSPSGITKVTNVGAPSGEDIQELVYAPDLGLVARDDADNVWIRGTRGWKLLQKEFPIVRVGWDSDYGLLLYQWDEKTLYCFRDSKLTPVYKKFHSELLGASAAGGFVVIRIAGNGISTLLFAHNGEIREVTRVTATQVFDAAKDSRNRFWFTTMDGLWVYEKGNTERTGDTMWRPDNIVAINHLVFVWSQDGSILYRVNSDTGMVDAVDLRDVGFGDAYVRRENTRSFAMKDAATGFFGFGPEIVEVSLARARCQRVKAGILT